MVTTRKFLGGAFSPHAPILIEEIGQGAQRDAVNTLQGLHKIAAHIKELKPETIIVITPHGTAFDDGFCLLNEDSVSGDLSQFGFPQIQMNKEIDQELTHIISEELDILDLPHILMDEKTAHDYCVHFTLDHGCLVPLHFIDKEFGEYKIVHITISGLLAIDHYQLGMALYSAILKSQTSTFILASADLSHALKETGPYSFHENGLIFDQFVVDKLKTGDFYDLLLIDNTVLSDAKQCGYLPLAAMCGAFDQFNVKANVYSYEGPFGVGYATGFISTSTEWRESVYELYRQYIQKLKGEKRLKFHGYVLLAYDAIEYYVIHERKLDFSSYKTCITNENVLQDLMNTKAGVFVGIYHNGALRGCIGTIAPTCDMLADEIIYNAISACSRDTRFDPISHKELEYLHVKVDILKEIEPIPDASFLDEKRYGVIVQSGNKRGLLLPNLENVQDVTSQVKIAKEKGGITDKEPYQLYRFEVIRYE